MNEYTMPDGWRYQIDHVVEHLKRQGDVGYGYLVAHLWADLNTARTTTVEAIGTAARALAIIDRLQANAAEDLAEIGRLRGLNARQALHCQRLIDRLNAYELVS